MAPSALNTAPHSDGKAQVVAIDDIMDRYVAAIPSRMGDGTQTSRRVAVVRVSDWGKRRGRVRRGVGGEHASAHAIR